MNADFRSISNDSKEPTSSSAPRFATRSLVHLIEDLRSSIPIFCPAQSYPAPTFRLADDV